MINRRSLLASLGLIPAALLAAASSRSPAAARVVGAFRLSPDYAEPPYVWWIGRDAYVRANFDFGHGPLEIEDVRIGETPLSEFSDVSWHTSGCLGHGCVLGRLVIRASDQLNGCPTINALVRRKA